MKVAREAPRNKIQIELFNRRMSSAASSSRLLSYLLLTPVMTRLENFPKEKQPLCLCAGRQSFYFVECIYADLCGLSRVQAKGDNSRKRSALKLSHVRDCTIVKSLPRQGGVRCSTMRMVKRWHTYRWPLIFVQRDDVAPADVVPTLYVYMCGKRYRCYA